MQKMVQAWNEKDMTGSLAAGTPKARGEPNDCFPINVTLGTILGEHTGGEQRRRGGDRGDQGKGGGRQQPERGEETREPTTPTRAPGPHTPHPQKPKKTRQRDPLPATGSEDQLSIPQLQCSAALLPEQRRATPLQ